MSNLLALRRRKTSDRFGVRRLLVIPSPDVEDIVFDSQERVEAITVASGKSFYELIGKFNECNFTQTITRADGVEVIQQSINFIIDAQDSTARLAFKYLGQCYSLHVLVQNMNYSWHYAGITYLAETDEWVTERMNTRGGNSSTGQNSEAGYTIQLGATCAHFAPYLNFDPITTLTIERPPYVPPADTTAPFPIEFNPQVANTAVPITAATYYIRFNEKIKAGTGNISLRNWDDDSLVQQWDITTLTIDQNGGYVYFDVTSSLSYDQGHYIQIDSGAIEDLAGNDYGGIAKAVDVDSTWYFKTQQEPDTTAPTIVSFVPASSPDIQLSSGVLYRLTFSEPIIPLEGIVELVQLTPDTILANMDVNSDSRITTGINSSGQGYMDFNIESLLINGETYELRFPNEGVSDQAFNAYVGGDVSYQFTTESGQAEFTEDFDLGFTS